MGARHLADPYFPGPVQCPAAAEIDIINPGNDEHGKGNDRQYDHRMGITVLIGFGFLQKV